MNRRNLGGKMSGTDWDVIQVGYGPVSKALAAMLARQGISVGIFEKFPNPYSLPRAVCIDHEIYRVLHSIGFEQELASVVQPAPIYQWFNAEWKVLLEIDWRRESISGGPEVNFVHQPTLEEALDQSIRRIPEIDLHLGWQVIGVRDQGGYVAVDLASSTTDARRTVTARYVIGVDGANSIVRESLGISQQDLGFEADWLVVDMLLKPGLTHSSLQIPAAGQYCNPKRPTTIVPGGIQDGQVCRRWEFMRLPHESRPELESREAAWALLSQWVKPDQAELVRHTVYNFRSLVADRWRVGRILLAGDAAHLMPPFMGQGMCSGMRDAWNLSWKLGLVLSGQADESLLDTYMAERRPHVTEIIRTSIYLGQIICISDADQAEARDQAFFDRTVPPPPEFPWIAQGIVHSDPDDRLAGRLSPHGHVDGPRGNARFDTYVGSQFAIIARGTDPRSELSPDQISFLGELGTQFVTIADGESHGGTLQDTDRKFIPFFDKHGVEALVLRPDFYIFGSAASRSELPRIVDSLRSALSTAGLRTSQSEPVQAGS
jgi:3-(3-hydroxy-phenyl)propionate hydroxylase/flavoprotein hydroxylase